MNRHIVSLQQETGFLFPSRPLTFGTSDRDGLLLAIKKRADNMTVRVTKSGLSRFLTIVKGKDFRKFEDGVMGSGVRNDDTWNSMDRIVDIYSWKARFSGKGYGSEHSYIDYWEHPSLHGKLESMLADDQVIESLYQHKVPAPRPSYVSVGQELYAYISSLLVGVENPRILDISAYGERGIAAASLGYNYTGIDPDPNLIIPHTRITEDVFRLWGSYLNFLPLTVEGFGGEGVGYDIMTISPPPFISERYTGDLQAGEVYYDFESWFNGFIVEVIIRAQRWVSPGGIFAVTILDRIGEGGNPITYTERTLNHILERGFEYVGHYSLASLRGTNVSPGTPWWIFKRKEGPLPLHPLIINHDVIMNALFSLTSFMAREYVRTMVDSSARVFDPSWNDTVGWKLDSNILPGTFDRESVFSLRNEEGSYEENVTFSGLLGAIERFLRWVVNTSSYRRALGSCLSPREVKYSASKSADVQRYLRCTALFSGPPHLERRGDMFRVRPTKPNPPLEWRRVIALRHIEEKLGLADQGSINDFRRALMFAVDDPFPDPIFPRHVNYTITETEFLRGKKRSNIDDLLNDARIWINLPEWDTWPPSKENWEKYPIGPYDDTKTHSEDALLLRYKALGLDGHQMTRTKKRNEILTQAAGIQIIDLYASVYNSGSPLYGSLFPDLEEGSLGPANLIPWIDGSAYMVNPPVTNGEDTTIAEMVIHRLNGLNRGVVFFGTTLWDDQGGTSNTLDLLEGSRYFKLRYELDYSRYPGIVPTSGEQVKHRMTSKSIGVVLAKNMDVDLETVSLLAIK